MRGFDAGKVQKAFSLPENEHIVCLLPMGYASEDAKPYAPCHDVNRDIASFTKEI